MKLRLVFALTCVALSSCTFSVPQAETALAWAKSFSQNKVNNPNQAPIWLASVGDSGAVVTPYSAGELIVFANVDGDAIAFDGWIVRSVTGFGLNAPLSIKGKEGERTFVLGQSIYAAQCGSWSWRQFIWKQRCDNGVAEIVVDAGGNVQKISMSLGKKLGFVTLQLANKSAGRGE